MTEAEVRDALRTEVLASAPHSAEAIFEFWVPQCNARADVAVVGTTMDGFEIKTERDTLKRLPRQADAYRRVFDRCHAVMAHRHVERALEILPFWWGVQLICDGPTFMTVRAAELNGNVDPETLVRLLWRDEVYAVLCELGVVPDPRASRFRMWELVLTLLDVEGLKRVVRDVLLARESPRERFRSRRPAVT